MSEDYGSMKVEDLKKELKARDLPTVGKKDELVERLLKNPKKRELEKEDKEEKSEKKQEKEEESGSPKSKKQKSEESKSPSKTKPSGTLDGFFNVTKKATTPTKESSTKVEDGSKSKVPLPAASGLLQHLTDESWRSVLQDEFSKKYFLGILEYLEKEKKSGAEIFPPENEIFTAFNLTPFDKVKVVIVGQDPYHDNNQAHGLCFSVKKGIAPPPSIKNMYKELEKDIPGFKTPKHGFLENWAKNGVLLINASLTVKAHNANSHSKIGWTTFTDHVIKTLAEKREGIVFLLLGGYAQKKSSIIKSSKKKNFIVEAAHPSPLSAAKFKDCKCFARTNEILEKEGYGGVDWTLPQTI